MSSSYTWVLHREAGHVMLPLRARLRCRLEAEFDVIARHPFAAPDDIARSADGREIRFVWNDPFWIGFTLDHAVQQVRIVSLTRENPSTL